MDCKTVLSETQLDASSKKKFSSVNLEMDLSRNEIDELENICKYCEEFNN